MNKIIQGDCIEIMKGMEENSVDTVITDPPYGLSFMGKKWDYSVPSVEVWKEALRVLKPGGYLLSFAGTRTQHRMAVNIEDAGFEIRDMIAWVYGSGFPKSLNVSKAIDKAAGASREVTGQNEDILKKQGADIKSGKRKIAESFDAGEPERDNGFKTVSADITAPATPEAQEWDGWGTALKPALEPITMARKPLSEKTIAANVLRWGTGSINIDGCRVGLAGEKPPSGSAKRVYAKNEYTEDKVYGDNKVTPDKGRFPANLIHDGSDEVMDLFPQSKGQQGSLKGHNKDRQSPNGIFGKMAPAVDSEPRNDTGSAARFFYCAKTSKKDRDEGLEHLPKKKAGMVSNTSGQHITRRDEGYEVSPRANNHPTVKPTKLMRYLCRLVTPPDGLIYDPFMGSGSTGKAAVLEGFGFIGSELEEEYCEIARARIK